MKKGVPLKLRLKYTFVPNESALDQSLKFLAQHFRENFEQIKARANKKNKPKNERRIY